MNNFFVFCNKNKTMNMCGSHHHIGNCICIRRTSHQNTMVLDFCPHDKN